MSFLIVLALAVMLSFPLARDHSDIGVKHAFLLLSSMSVMSKRVLLP